MLAAAGAEEEFCFGGGGGEFGALGYIELGDDEELGREVAVVEFF